SASPSAPFRRDEADHTKRGNRPASARTTNDQRNAARLDRGHLRSLRNRRAGFGAFQNSEISGSVSACKRRGNHATIGQCDLNIFIAAEYMVSGDNDSWTPDDAAG